MRSATTKIWKEGPVDTTEVLIKALIDQQSKSGHEDPVNSNFNLVMQQIMQLRHENRELKQLIQFKSADSSLSPASRSHKKQSHLSAKSVRSISALASGDQLLSGVHSSMMHVSGRNCESMLTRNSGSRPLSSQQRSIRKSSNPSHQYEVEFLPENSEEQNQAAVRISANTRVDESFSHLPVYDHVARSSSKSNQQSSHTQLASDVGGGNLGSRD